ncbi:MAG: gliding motility-associated transport system permease protein [Pseudomonadota bacterium]|nr:gliding motility-associated transport system permease protein [Pseudomonadota bacterium]
MILHIALKELKSLFLSPLAWTILAVLQAILAWIFFIQVDTFLTIQPQLAALPNAPGVTDLVVAPVLANASVLLLIICPLLTMRLLSEERRSGSLQLLLSSPVSMTQIALGKYLGVMFFLLILLAQISLMLVSLYLGTTLDAGKLVAGLLGSVLLLAAFAAAGLYLSSLTKNPVVAAVSTFGLLLMLWIIDAAGSSSGARSELFGYLSLLSHQTPLLRGIVDSRDVIYYLLFIITFLTLTIRHLDAQRLQK